MGDIGIACEYQVHSTKYRKDVVGVDAVGPVVRFALAPICPRWYFTRAV